jgi:type I restriction enzyme, S subunit
MTGVELRRVARLAYGRALATGDRTEGNIPVISSGGRSGSHAVANTGSPVIVVGRKGSHGSVHWSDHAAFVIDTAFYVDSATTRADLRWLYYALISLDLRTLTQDVGVPGLSRERAHEAILAQVPSLPEQRRIADFLDDQVGRIEKLVSLRRRQGELLTQRLGAALEGLLVRSDAESRFLAALTDPARPIQYGIILPGRDFPGGVPIVKGGDVAAGRLSPDLLNRTDPTIDARYPRSRLRSGDLLIAIRGSVGEVAEVPPALENANITQDAARIAPRSCDAAWLRWVIQTPSVQGRVRRMMTGATVRGINIGDLRKVRVPWVPRSLQQQLGARATELAAESAASRAVLRRSIELLSERKRALITAAVTGEFDVSTASTRAAAAVTG